MAHALWNYKINKACSLYATDAVNAIYFYDMEVISIDDWRVVPGKSRDNSGWEPHQPKQYHPYFASHDHRKLGTSYPQEGRLYIWGIDLLACSAIECACYEV